MSSIREQIKILKSKNLNFKSESKARKILLNENYYNLINAYKDLFLDYNYHPLCQTDPDEKYLNGTEFDELYNMFLFDKKIRNIFLKYFFIVENQIKTHIAYEFSLRFGEYGYLDYKNFNKLKVFDVISMHKDINLIIVKNKNSNRIKHFLIDKDSLVPIWALVSFFNIGITRIFYSNLEIKLQNKIGKNYYNLQSNGLLSMISTLNMFRNVCAHDNRLYCYRIIDIDKCIKDLPIHSKLFINKNFYNEYQFGKKDLFACVILLKYLLLDDLFNEFIDLIKKEIDNLSNKIKTISTKKILEKMGFPLLDSNTGQKDWYDIKYLSKF